MTAREDYAWRIPYWIRNDPRLEELWLEGAAEFGYDEAERYVRSTDYYAEVFPGIKRDDGSYRMEENEYLANMDSYRQSIAAVGVNPELFESRFIELIEGDVSGNEFWQERVAPIYDRVMDRGEEMMARYADDWGIDMTREALIASLLDPEMVGDRILNRQIGISEIRYEIEQAYGDAGVDRYASLATDLYEEGRSQDEVERLITASRTDIPILSVLARRHNDPDDEFDLNEFTAATLWNDPQQARRMRRLIAQEQAQFTGSTLGFVRDQQGGVAGLQAQ